MTKTTASNPLVTIGIPCYQCASHLPALMRSIQAQTYSNWDIVAIDDGSTDGTRELLKQWESPRVRVVLDETNRGLSYRLNQIAELAQGSLLARTDADDLMMPSRLQRQVNAFLQDPSLDVVSSGCYVVDDRNQLRGLRSIPDLARSAAEVMLRNGPSHPTVMTTTSWARTNQYRGQWRRGEDLDLWIRTIEHSHLRYLPEPLHVIREDPRFDYAKYLRTLRDHQEVVRTHLRGRSRPALRLAVELRLLVRMVSYQIGHRVGASSAMAARRNLPLPCHAAQEVQQILATLCAPGPQAHPAQ